MSTGEDSTFLEAGIDVESANAARMYDDYLGGAHNFAVELYALGARDATSPAWRVGSRGAP